MELHPAELLLRYALVPLWLVAGLADWYCHRRTHIETTSGLAESLLHWVMFAVVGLGLMAALLLQVTAGVFLLEFVLFLVHEGLAWWDLHYTSPLRPIFPVEQMIHSFLELLPLAAFGLLAVQHWDQFRALITGAEDARFAFVFRDEIPGAYVSLLLVGVFVFTIVPYGEELLRTWRARS